MVFVLAPFFALFSGATFDSPRSGIRVSLLALGVNGVLWSTKGGRHEEFLCTPGPKETRKRGM